MSKSTTGLQPLEIIDEGSAPAVPAMAPIAMEDAPTTTDGASTPPASDRDGSDRDGDARARVIIVGSGPAGLTAAIYAARADLAPILIAGFVPGGQLMITSDVENYPGFPEGIQGPELMDRMRQQAERFGARMKDVDVERVDLSERPFRITAGGTTYTADALIVATGASAIWLELEAETRLRGRGVSACATCDGFFFRDRTVAVVGGGDSALEEALFLTKFASHVVIVHRRDQLRGSRIMQNRALDHPKISLRWNKEVVDVLGEDRVIGVRLRDTVTGEESEEVVDGLFVAIGYTPNTEVFRDWLEVDAKGYLVVHDETLTAVEGVFVAGDVHDHRYRQAVTAAGDGCKAAIDAERWLEEQAAETETTGMAAGSAALATS